MKITHIITGCGCGTAGYTKCICGDEMPEMPLDEFAMVITHISKNLPSGIAIREIKRMLEERYG